MSVSAATVRPLKPIIMRSSAWRTGKDGISDALLKIGKLGPGIQRYILDVCIEVRFFAA